jgi:hypothetical protein
MLAGNFFEVARDIVRGRETRGLLARKTRHGRAKDEDDVKANQNSH